MPLIHKTHFTERRDDKTYERRRGRIEATMLDEISVYYRVEKMVVYRVIDMRILIVVTPLGEKIKPERN